MNKMLSCMRLNFLLLGALYWQSQASAQILNTRLVSHLPLGADTETGDLWAAGNYIYVARGTNGLDVIDSATQSNPTRVFTTRPFDHANFSDVHVVNGYAYVANTVANGSPEPWVGLFIYSLANPGAPVEVGRIEWGAGAWYHLAGSVHSVYVDATPTGPIGYMASEITGDVEIFDLSNPANPVWLSSIHGHVLSYYVQSHDMIARNGRLYTTWLSGGVTVHDVNNPAIPISLATNMYSGAFTYHLWLTDDSQHLCVSDNSPSGHLKIFNVSNPAAGVPLVGIYSSGTGAVLHDVKVKGKYAYMAYFGDGLRIVDISVPSNPRSVGWYDPDPGANVGGVTGAWGVHPLGNNVYMSHSSRGLYIIDFVDTITITKAVWSPKNRDLVVEARSTVAPGSALTLAGYGLMNYNSSTQAYSLTVLNVANPATVTVVSDLGGSATATVRRK